jgi:CheY-like chemotaxis protein
MAKKVLVIDDEKDVIDYLTTVLKYGGYDVLSASNVDEAIEMVKEHEPDLITLDIIMPGKTGIKGFEKLRRTPGIRNDIPVIVVTGYQQTEHRQMNPEFLMEVKTVPRPVAFFEKPLDEKEFLDAVAKALA